MKSLTPPELAPPFARYSHGVELPPGARLLRSSGQLGMARDGTIPPDVFDQAMLCFENITAILGAAGMTAADVFHLSAYVTQRAEMEGYMRARDRFLETVPEDRLPASTLMIVSGFTREEFKVEVEVSAARV